MVAKVPDAGIRPEKDILTKHETIDSKAKLNKLDLIIKLAYLGRPST